LALVKHDSKVLSEFQAHNSNYADYVS